MGWWDYGIMGGDTPLDIQGDFLDAMHRTYTDELDWSTGYWLLGPPSGLHILMWVVAERERWMNHPCNYINKEYYLVSPVVAYVILELGLTLDPALRNIVLVDLAYEITRIDNGESLFNEPQGRKAALIEMMRGVEAYTGLPGSEPNSPGLFEKMAEHLGAN